MFPIKILSRILAPAILCASLLLVATMAGAAVKIFVKEYTYQASEIDSKVTSRAIALEQVKRLLLEEFGTFLISETDVKNFQLTKDKVTVLTAGIVKTEILVEKWDGNTYYVKAKITADPRETAKIIEELKENSQKNRELEETSRKADEALKKIKQLQDELAAGKFPDSRQPEYFKAVEELKWKEWIDKGVAFMAVENYEAALNAFNKAVDINPNNPWAYIDKGWALNTLGDHYQALKELNKASVIDPQNPWIYINRGVSYNFLGNYKQALADEDEAIRLDAAIAWAYIDRGWAYIGLGDYRRALADLDKAAQMDPDNPHIYSMRAWADNGLGNKAQVLEDFDKSLSLAPNNSWMHWNIATYYALTNEKAKALAELGKAIRLNSTLKQRAKADKSFEYLWNDADFRKLVD
jgi:tetratricopeptide (TPR) repeat protein